jgi:acyl carrier protein
MGEGLGISAGAASERVRAFLIKEFEVPAEQVRSEARLVEDLGLDSLDLVEMVVELESAAGCRIPNEKLKALRTVGNAVELIESARATG